MKVLVINCGSSTIKYQMFDQTGEEVLAKGIVARIGEEGSYVSQVSHAGQYHKLLPVYSHADAFEQLILALIDHQYGVLHDRTEVSAVGHRAVHGADVFIESILIDEQVIEKMKECIPLAPLHNPANLLGIQEAMQIFPNIPHVAVFDTSFHQTLPPYAYLYAIPIEYYENHKIRKYGFHGTSCRFVTQRASQILDRPLATLRMVVCHLGNGVTIAAVKNGKSVDTSIGFATFSGVMMGTRCGDIDPGLVFYFNKQLGMNNDQVEQLYYKESGLLGVSGVSNDMRLLVEKAGQGHKRSQLAVDMFTYRVKAYIGAYVAAMGGLDALIFTAGIGENSAEIRWRTCQGLEFLGLHLDAEKNAIAVGGIEANISTADASVSTLVVPTNEEKVIAMDTIAIAQKSQYPG